MKANLLLRLFPPPQFLEQPAAGLDISDRSVKFFEFLPITGSWRSRERFGEMILPPDVIESGHIKDKPALVAGLADFAKSHKLSRVNVSLPEEKVYVARITLPFMKPRELAGSVEFALEEHIPLLASEAVFDYEVVRFPKNEADSFELAVTALPRQTAEEYVSSLVEAGLIPLVLETEAHALARAFGETARSAGETIMIIDIGKTRTGIFIAEGAVVLYSSTIANLGGDDFTKAVAKMFNLDFDDAERRKIKQGMRRSLNGDDLFTALLPVAGALKDEIIKRQIYWRSQVAEGIAGHSKISKVVLCGGQATLPGLVDYLAENLGWDVVVGNVWTNTEAFIGRRLPDLSRDESLRYASAVGLALRRFSSIQ